jgi:hypothetical protein
MAQFAFSGSLKKLDAPSKSGPRGDGQKPKYPMKRSTNQGITSGVD